MIARVHRFLRGRGMRKFSRSKLGLAALAVILVYLGIAGLVGLGGVITLDETLERASANSLPGLGVAPSGETRIEAAEFHLNQVDALLRRRDPQRAVAEFDLCRLRVANLPLAELRARVDAGFALYDALSEVEDLEQGGAVAAQLAALEERAMAVYLMPTGLDAAWRSLALSLGTDRQGRSIALRALYSVKVAVQVGLVTALIAVLLGTLLGAAAAFFGSWVDHLVIWLYSTFSGIPYLVLLTVLVYAFTGTVFDGTLVPLYAAFSMTFWIGPCRVVRGEVLKLKELEYVQAATAVGFSRLYILVRHVVPNTAHLMFIYFSLLFIAAIKSEVILSFLGLGVKKGPSWGIMISQSKQEVINGFFWQIGAATFFMFGLVLAFNILTDALQDAFDPKHVS